jgi:hypothetical protein
LSLSHSTFNHHHEDRHSSVELDPFICTGVQGAGHRNRPRWQPVCRTGERGNARGPRMGTRCHRIQSQTWRIGRSPPMQQLLEWDGTDLQRG